MQWCEILENICLIEQWWYGEVCQDSQILQQKIVTKFNYISFDNRLYFAFSLFEIISLSVIGWNRTVFCSSLISNDDLLLIAFLQTGEGFESGKCQKVKMLKDDKVLAVGASRMGERQYRLYDRVSISVFDVEQTILSKGY